MKIEAEEIPNPKSQIRNKFEFSKSHRFEHLDIGILDLFSAWCLGFGIYGLRIRFRPLKNFLQ
jgi:hypothetical protein